MWRQVTLALCCVLLLAGCDRVADFYDTKLTLDTPIDWWHQLQGGPIADDRPPPPGVNDPYPNLGQVPARPTPTDPATRRALFARLAAQRDQTRRDALQDPIQPVPPIIPPAAIASASPAGNTPAAVSAPPPPPQPAGVPPPDPGASTAVLEAATATPVPEVPTAPVAVSPPPAAFTAPPRRPSAATAATAALPADVPGPNGPVPALPVAAPALPQLRGIPGATTAPATPRPLPSVPVAFHRGSADLPPEAAPALKDLAARRAGALIQITAHGDAGSTAPAAQEAALPLALRRARAIADALAANGVPATSLRSDAQALGRGGIARLVN